ncbi:protein Shroom2-like isoform X1 [Anguilla anguilla]|uniref:protein Shroom2-like isoform X1 n=1 Tax=Anguilla anguilla TaxID=7936 RepID=UPI0015A7DB96|nr:protein Shroom2-like isoform X1 [Anguilla anguilla]
MHTSVERRSDPRFTAREHEPPQESLSHKAGILGPLEPKVSGGDGWRLVDVLLTGGAPWGFSLKGGLEYHEPLIITKVEEGSQAWAVRLQVGDEVVAVNEYPLSGYRQEAIGLVKGSHKTLALGVRRRTETVNRPHSWHSIKFAEAQSEASKRRTTDTVVSRSQYDASLSSDDLSRGWDHTNLRRVSNQFSSLGSMDSLEHCPPPCPTGPLSQAKPSSSTEYLGGAKRDSAYSSFSTGSGTPDHILSTENVACRAGAWDPRNWQSLDEKQGVGHGEGRDNPRHSSSATGGRASFGPIWHVPDKKRTAEPSPPPPPLPVRSDSFAVTKVHSEGPDPYAEQRPPAQGRGVFRAPDSASMGPQADDRGPGVRWSYHPTSKNDEHFPPHSSGYGSQASSRSSVEFPSGHAPRHQQQYCDESAVYPQHRVTAATMPPDTGGYYSITQEQPADSLPPPSGHAWTSATSATGTLDPDPCADYYCVTAAHRPPAREEDRKGGGGGVEMTRGAKETDQNSKSHKAKLRLSHPLPQGHYPNDQDSNYYGKQTGPPLDQLVAKPNGNERRSQGRDNGYHAESRYVNFPLSKHESEEGQASQPRETPQDAWLSQEAVHSQYHMGAEAGSLQGPCPPNPQTGQQVAGNERFATILRNEIQERRIRLQKSQSTTALTGPAQAEEEEKGPEVSTETSASSSDGSFSTSYKDHLKEVQARVLQATSFRRRDLEPDVSPPASAPAAILRPEAPPPAGAVVSRIGGRKRFPPEKKVRSVSEPNKMHQVGVAGAEPEPEPSHPEPAGSLADRRKVFELTGKPVFQKPFLKQARGGRTKGGAGGGTHTGRGLPEGQRASLGQQPCTFAEYDPSWNVQWKPSGAKPAGRCHSADNILDPAVDDWNRTPCVHERARSSPTAELYAQSIPGSGRTSAEFSYPEDEPGGHEGATPRVSEQQHGVLGGRQNSSQLERFSEPPPEGALWDDPESRGIAAALPPDHGYLHRLSEKPLPRNPEVPPPYQESQSRGSAPGEAGPRHLRARSQPKAERSRRSEGVPSPASRRDPGPEENRRATLGAGSSQQEPPPAPSSSSSCDPASQLRPPMDGLHPPRPQLAPQRPGDQPPASMRHDAPCSRMESLSESSSRSRAQKGPVPVPGPVPVRITHEAESCSPLGPAQEPRPPACISREQRRAEGQDSTYPGAPLEAPPPQPASTNGISLEEEQKREELARDIVGRDQSLADILDRSGMRTTMDLMEGIFPQGGALLEGTQQRRKPAPRQASQGPRSSPERREEDNMAAAVGLVTSSSYYFTSAPKAELLNKMKDMPGFESEDEQDLDLACKKHQLIDSLTSKLQVLKEARESLLEDVSSNNALGEEVESSVEQVCRPNELDKFRMFVGDLDKVVSLLLSLSGRLARVENALNTLPEDSTPEEKRTLTGKRAVLIRQHEDAKELKENLDRRESLVSHILASHLSEERLADFRHFVKMKAELIIEQRKLDDKIKLGEEQLKCLMDSLPPEQRPPF